MFAFMEVWDISVSFSFSKAGFFMDELIVSLFSLFCIQGNPS